MQALRREENSARPKVVKVTAQTMAALFKGRHPSTLVPATLVVTDAGETIVRAAPTALHCWYLIIVL
jgi:hypothetical protein